MRWCHYIFALLCSVIITYGQSHECNRPLGVSNGKIRDSSLTSSFGRGAQRARLNGGGAWCFNANEAQGKEVSLAVDFGSTTFISAVLTQGPPLNMKNKEYNYHIGFYIENSTEAESNSSKWDTCCGGKKKLFYAEDTLRKSEEIQLHAIGTLLVAKRIRLRFETTVRWAGYNEKCFRIEVIGCSKDLTPQTNLTVRALASGWVETVWEKPTVMIPNAFLNTMNYSYNLPLNYYLVNLTVTEEVAKGEKVTNSTLFTVDVPRVMVPSPIWGAIYSLSLTCPYQGLFLPCENSSILATVRSCETNVSSCLEKDKVIFRRPQRIQSWVVRPTSSADSSSTVFLQWDLDNPGWVTTSTMIHVIDKDKTEVVIQQIKQENTILLKNLVGRIFNLTFTPQANSLKSVPPFFYDLHIIPWSTLDATKNKDGYGAFVTDVTLESHIHWEGRMIITWSPALVREGSLETIQDGTSKGLEIQLSSQFIGQANVYNVSLKELSENAHLQTKTVSFMNELKVEFPLLKLKTTYQVSISCDYGGIMVQCGSAIKVTELPIKMTELSSELLVYVRRSSGESWYRQEESCRKGNGTLATFSTMEEETFLRSSLINANLEYFWIGLNMCPGNKGTLWSDGSPYIYNLLPQVDAGLSASTCCIKAQKSDVQFKWLGEACNALLPALCEYKPIGLVGLVANLTAGNATLTTVSYEWDFIEMYWTPTSFTSTICPTIDLTTWKHLNRSCSATTISVDERSFASHDLPIFTEFNISVCASLPSLEYNGVNQSILARTSPPEPVFLHLRSNGHLNVMWAQKVAEFGEDDLVDVVLYSGEEFAEVIRTQAPARNVTIGDLRLGDRYRIKLSEREGEKRQEIRDFYAYPPCNCSGCQDKTRCIFPSDKQVPKSLALSSCNAEDANLAISLTRERLEVLLRQAEKVYDDLWVSSSSVKGNALPHPATLARDHVSSGSGQATTQKPQDFDYGDCLLVSRSQQAIIVAADCRENHYAACERRPYLPPLFPSPSDISVRVAGTWMLFRWNPSYSGWKANYTIYYQRKSQSQVKRALRYKEFTSPPVLIDDLEKNTQYSIEMVADLGSGFLSTSEEFVGITSDSNTRSDEVAMSAGWSPSPEFYLSHLICGAFLIAASISAMLLFFATGMFYQDCVAQLGFLSCIMAAYLLLLVAHPHYVTNNENACVVLSAILHFLFMSAFFFLCMEALTLSHLLLERIKSPFEKSNWALVFTALFAPLVYVGISAGIIQVGYPYTARDNCWVNVSGPVLIVQVVPNCLAMLLTIVLVLITIKSDEASQPVLKDYELRGRQSDAYRLRWVILTLSVELGVVWAAGVAAYHTHQPQPHSIFNAFTLIMALTIGLARTWLDDTLRSKIHRLCCGTELTYKRSAKSVLDRARVHPATHREDVRPSILHGSVTKASQTTGCGATMYDLPNASPSSDSNTSSSAILVKRTFKFER